MTVQMVVMMMNYNIVIDNNYLDKCTSQHKNGMFPTFEILFKHIDRNSELPLIPSSTNSKIINVLSDYFTFDEINNYFISIGSYRNVCIPLSKRYTDLSAICNRIRQMWYNHDLANSDKFIRIITAITEQNEISPLYNRHTKYTKTETTTPDTTATETRTGTESLGKGTAETLSGKDTQTITNNTSETSTNSVSPENTNEFYNSDRNVIQNGGTDTKETTYGKTTTMSGTDTKTYNTTFTDKLTGSTDIDGDGQTWENTMSIAEIQQREIVMNTILDMYFNSVFHEISLSVLEEIY